MIKKNNTTFMVSLNFNAFMVAVTLTQTPSKHKKMNTRPGKVCGQKITDSCLIETKMNLSIAFQSLQTLELNGRHTVVCEH